MVALGLEEPPKPSLLIPESRSELNVNTNGTGAGTNAAMSRRPSVALQKIHWSPLANEKLQKSIWAQGGNGAGSTNNSQSISNEDDLNPTDLMCDEDVEEIEKLFRATTKATRSNTGLKVNDNLKDKMKLYVIEGKRAQNITIGLAQYKSLILSCSPASSSNTNNTNGNTNTNTGSSNAAPLDYNILLNAIYTLNTLNNKLCVDHLENIVPLLPTPSELKILSSAKNSQHPAEKFIYLTLQYANLQKRLNVFVICENFNENCNFSTNQAKSIISACNEVNRWFDWLFMCVCVCCLLVNFGMNFLIKQVHI